MEGRYFGVIFPRKSGSRIIMSGGRKIPGATTRGRSSGILETKWWKNIFENPTFLTQAWIQHSRMLAKQTPSNYYYYYYYYYYTILYYTILLLLLYYTILYYSILYCTILHYTITIHYTILYYTILYDTILYYTILYYTIIYY